MAKKKVKKKAKKKVSKKCCVCPPKIPTPKVKQGFFARLFGR